MAPTPAHSQTAGARASQGAHPMGSKGRFGVSIALTLAFVLVLLVTHVIHVWYLPVSVILYSALQDTLVAAAAMGLVLWRLRRWTGLSTLEMTLLAVVWLLIGYCFSISVPTVIDRSLSFYILEKLDQRGGGILQSRMEDVFVKEYMPEFRLIDVRLTEQLASGTIRIENGCVILTPRGQRAARFSRFIRTNFIARHRLLAGRYTDALVDPFKNSPKGKMGYECDGTSR